MGVNADGNGEVFRLNLEVGRFMRGYEIDVGGDDLTTVGGGALQGGINAGSVNTGAIAEDSHNLLAFGTSLGTVEFWDSRSRNRVGILTAPNSAVTSSAPRSEITALTFNPSGLELATGDSNGLIHLYDLRSPIPLLKKDQGYSFPIKNLIYLNSSTTTRAQTSEPKILSADKKIIKIWDPRDGTPWTSAEPAVDLNHVEWVKDSGMLLTANEGRNQHAFFIPQLGPAPQWCSFLDNIVEEMAEDPNDPHSFAKQQAGEVYDNFKFLTLPQLKQLNLDHLVGTTSLLRPYMHGFFVAQKLYEEARLISNPDLWQEQRAKSIAEKINKERESRIRGTKKGAQVKVNRKLAERILERQEKEERRRAKRVLEKGGDDDMVEEGGAVKAPEDADAMDVDEEAGAAPKGAAAVLHDPRFAKLFQDEDFEVDEASHEFQAINPSTKLPKGLTAVEQEELESARGSSSDEDSDESEDDRRSRNQKSKAGKKAQADDADKNRISSSSYKKSGHKSQRQLERERERESGPRMLVSSSTGGNRRQQKDRTFGARAEKLRDGDSGRRKTGSSNTVVVGEREITFAPEKKSRRPQKGGEGGGEGDKGQKHDRSWKDRRSASGNVFRRM